MEGMLLHARPLFFPYLQKETRLSVYAIKGYRAAFNHVFTPASTEITANKVIR